jgi:hypothetical protein
LAAFSDYTSARQKIGRIESDTLKPGARVELTTAELTAYVTPDLPDGIRNPRLEILGPGRVKGSALVDFNRVRRAQGAQPGWLMSRLLEGERPVAVTGRIRSGNGQATVDVDKVEIGGLVIDGATLDFLVRNFLEPAYPNAAVGEPFELGHRIDKIDVQPGSVSVLIGR